MSEYGRHPKDVAGVVSEYVTLETGEQVKGVVCLDPSQPFRRIIATHSMGTSLAEKLTQPSQEYRVDQAKDLATWYESDLLRSRPVSVGDLKELVQKAEAAEASAREQPPAEKAPDVKLEVKAESDSEGPDENVHTADMLLPTERLQISKGKGKGKKQAKVRVGGKSDAPSPKRRRSSKATFGDCAATMAEAQVAPVGSTPGNGDMASQAKGRLAAGSVAGSIAGSVSSKLDQLEAQAEKYVHLLSLKDVLAGDMNRNNYNIAMRVEKALRNNHKGSHVGVELKAHLNLVDAAVLLSPANIHSLSKTDFEKYASDILPMVAVEDIPRAFMIPCVTKVAKETSVSSASALDEWVEMVIPGEKGGYPFRVSHQKTAVT